MDKKSLIISTLALFEANYGIKLDSAYRAFIVRRLQPLPESVITTAFDTVIEKYSRSAQDEQYKLYAAYPDWACIKREIDKLYKVPTESELAELKAETAWNSMLTAIETYGSHRMPEGLDATTAYCIRSLGGWRAVCNWRESELQWRKKEFLELFAMAYGRTDELMLGMDAIESLGQRSATSLPAGIDVLLPKYLAERRPANA